MITVISSVVIFKGHKSLKSSKTTADLFKPTLPEENQWWSALRRRWSWCWTRCSRRGWRRGSRTSARGSSVCRTKCWHRQPENKEKKISCNAIIAWTKWGNSNLIILVCLSFKLTLNNHLDVLHNTILGERRESSYDKGWTYQFLMKFKI